MVRFKFFNYHSFFFISFQCLWLARFLGRVEVQQNIINQKINSITVFYGDFIDLTNNDY